MTTNIKNQISQLCNILFIKPNLSFLYKKIANNANTKQIKLIIGPSQITSVLEITVALIIGQIPPTKAEFKL